MVEKSKKLLFRDQDREPFVLWSNGLNGIDGNNGLFYVENRGGITGGEKYYKILSIVELLINLFINITKVDKL